MSGFIGPIIGAVVGRLIGHQDQANAISTILQQIIGPDGSGITSLTSRFRQAGLGDTVQSWVSNGPNQPITPEQIDQVFQPEELEGWAKITGTTPDALRAILANTLPPTVDHVTTNITNTPPHFEPDPGDVQPPSALRTLAQLLNKS